VSGLARERLRGFQLLSAKPLLLVVNLDEADARLADDATAVAGIADVLAATGAGTTGVCARIELEIAALEPADAQAFLADLGLRESGLDRIIRAAYDLLGYISFFTVGEDECRAWTIRDGATAVEAAGEIHTDLQKSFIRAEVVGYDDLISAGSLAEARARGTLKLEGKEYVVRDGEIVHIRHSA
jgi:ribosome-binding ATPase YchF (GTP1/OBG family)